MEGCCEQKSTDELKIEEYMAAFLSGAGVVVDEST